MAELTPRIAQENGWSAYAYCPGCKEKRQMHLSLLLRTDPDRDLGQALASGKLTCRNPDCARPSQGLDVVKYEGGRPRQIMKMTPAQAGLTIVRRSSDGET